MSIQYKELPTRKYIIIHSSFTTPDQHIGVAEIEREHRMQCKLSIGYHYVIRRDGTLENGRPANRAGAHTTGHDHHSIGICMIGGADKQGKPANNFQQAQFKQLKWLIGNLAVSFPEAKVVGHNKLNPNTRCPSFSVQSWLMKEGLAKLSTTK